jgi:hypothetical protein
MASNGKADQKATADKKTTFGQGRKLGGKMFPRIGLDQALVYSKKLVSKTAVSAQPEATILAGVFGNAGSDGKVRLSALKQFGLIEGNSKAYSASQLAKDIEIAADDAERQPLLRQAFLSATVFQELYNTYQDDQASKAKIKGRAQQLGVHPELTEGCADLFISSSITAKLASVEGDGIRLLPSTHVNRAALASLDQDETDATGVKVEENQTSAASIPDPKVVPTAPTPKNKPEDPDTAAVPRPRTAADVSINLTVDSSLDGDKLEKHLALLRRYGLI